MFAIILKLFSILYHCYYSQNYSGIIISGLVYATGIAWQTALYGLYSTEPEGHSPAAVWHTTAMLYVLYILREVAIVMLPVDVCPSVSRQQTQLVCLRAPKAVT